MSHTKQKPQLQSEKEKVGREPAGTPSPSAPLLSVLVPAMALQAAAQLSSSE